MNSSSCEFNRLISSIEIRDQLVVHGWCSRLSIRFSSFNTDEFEKTIHAMIPLIDVCRANFISLIPILDKLKTNLNDDLTYTDMLNNIQILLTKLRQRSSDDL